MYVMTKMANFSSHDIVTVDRW